MVPFFRRGEYGDGLLAGATRVARRIAEARNVTLDVQPPPARRPERSVGLRINPIAVLILLYILYRLLRGGGPRGARGRVARRAGAGARAARAGEGDGARAGVSWEGALLCVCVCVC